MKREVPFAFLAFGLCALADYTASEYIFKQNEQILLKYTGFKDGIYVNPAKFLKMKNNFRNQAERVYVDSENDLMDDDEWFTTQNWIASFNRSNSSIWSLQFAGFLTFQKLACQF